MKEYAFKIYVEGNHDKILEELHKIEGINQIDDLEEDSARM
jgi:hypothetical protein